MHNIEFDNFKVIEVKNPSPNCVHIFFENENNPDIKKKQFILFEQQIKYIIINEHKNFTKIKIYTRWDNKEIVIKFLQDNKELLNKFLKSVFNSD